MKKKKTFISIGLISLLLCCCNSNNIANTNNINNSPILSEDGKTITYGLYPQKNVNDETLIAALDKITTAEANGWYLYNGEYYAKTVANPRRYKGYDYVFDNGTTIVAGETYWFKCEPIIWNVLSNNNGIYYIISSDLLDVHNFHNSYLDRNIGGKTIHSNNYEHSDIRVWLNNDFYNSAFALDDSYIQTTIVDNSAATTESSDNPCACGNTEDKVFLPSYQDFVNPNYGFSATKGSDSARCGKATEWARTNGAWWFDMHDSIPRTGHHNSCYLTRSPYVFDEKWIEFYKLVSPTWMIYADGTLFHDSPDDFKCVRPAITIKVG